MWQFIALLLVGLVQLGLGFAGIEYHLGVFWAFAALVVAFWFRILLPITIGSFFGAVDVMGWPWYIGVAVALPGLMFIAPSMVMAALGALNDTDKQKNRVTEQQPERYWGIIIFSVAWVMVMLILNAIAGTQGAGNIITVLWLWVAYLAFRGNAQAIATVAKFVMIFQVVVGGIFFIVLLNDPGMQIYLGPPELFLFGLAIPLVAWAILYSWSSSIVKKDSGLTKSAFVNNSTMMNDVEINDQNQDFFTSETNKPCSYLSETEYKLKNLAEDAMYEYVIEEVANDEIDAVAQARALEDAAGDFQKAKAFYIQNRIRRLKDFEAAANHIANEVSQAKVADETQPPKKETTQVDNVPSIVQEVKDSFFATLITIAIIFSLIFLGAVFFFE